MWDNRTLFSRTFLLRCLLRPTRLRQIWLNKEPFCFCSLGLVRWRGPSSWTAATQRCYEKNVSAVHWSRLSKPVCYQEFQSNLWLLWEVHRSSSSGVDTGRPPSVLRRNTSLFHTDRGVWREVREDHYLSGKLPTYPSPKPTFCP